jgi:hypothetical protein
MKGDDKPRSLIPTVLVTGLLAIVPPLLAKYGPESVRRSLQALQRGVFWEMKSPSHLQFETIHRQLGVLSRGATTVEFTFENRSDQPVKISRATSSCGCVRVSLPSKATPAGGTDKIVLHLDTTDTMSGSMWELAKIFTDVVPDAPYILMIEAEVK